MASKPIAGDRVIDPTDQTTINHILKTIRTKESGGNYTAINKGHNTTNWATGAYQFLNSTWKGLSKGVESAAGIPSAYQAPPSVQDFVAEIYVRQVLASHGNHLAAVPVSWYYPRAWDNDALLDAIPAPQQGNTQTVRQYAENWIKTYDGTPVQPNERNTSQVVPDGLPGIGTQILDALNPSNVFHGLTNIGEVFAKMFEILTSAGTWIRVLQVLGGLSLVGMGLWIVTHNTSDMVPRLPVAAATL